jgi:hypothetical protein
MNNELEQTKELYGLTLKSVSLPPPKQGFWGWKCPSYGIKLKKKSLTYPILAGENVESFVKQIIEDNNLPPGLHTMEIDSFTCACGYLFAERWFGKLDFNADGSM